MLRLLLYHKCTAEIPLNKFQHRSVKDVAAYVITVNCTICAKVL